MDALFFGVLFVIALGAAGLVVCTPRLLAGSSFGDKAFYGILLAINAIGVGFGLGCCLGYLAYVMDIPYTWTGFGAGFYLSALLTAAVFQTAKMKKHKEQTRA